MSIPEAETKTPLSSSLTSKDFTQDDNEEHTSVNHSVIVHVESILQIRQYSERAKAVYAWGKTTQQNFQIDTFGESTFEALAGICAARGAIENKKLSHISSAKFVTHPSSLVRSTSVSSGLLSNEEAKSIFLSEDSSRETQRMLVRTCSSLPADAETMSLALKLDEEGGFLGGGLAWTVLIRTHDENFFLKYAPLCIPSTRVWQGASAKQPLSLAIIHRFPNAVLELTIKNQLFEWRFNWLCALAQHQQSKNNNQQQQQQQQQQQAGNKKRLTTTTATAIPATTTAAESLFTFLLNPPPGFDLRPSIDNIIHDIIKWGWKPFYSLLLTITEKGSFSSNWTRVRLLRALHGSRATFNMKLEAVLSVFPKIGRPEEAAEYIKLFPTCDDEKRTDHSKELLTGFWNIVSVSQTKKPWDLFKILATSNILPREILVKEFLAKNEKVLSSPTNLHVDAWKRQELEVFLFILTLCEKDPERLEVLLALFHRKDVATPAGVLELFLRFRTSVRSSFYLKEGFNKLCQLLGGKAVKTELQAVVSKMAELENKESVDNPKLKMNAETLPRNWVLFCGSDSSFSSVGLFLRATLLNLSEGPLLPSLVAKFGRAWFWDLFSTVLQGAQAPILAPKSNNSSASTPSASSLFPAQLLSQLSMVGVDEKSSEQKILSSDSSSNNSTSSSSSSSPQMDPVYKAKEEEVKKRTFGKDYLERQKAYSELIEMSTRASEQYKKAVYDDCVPFLVKRLDREQETVKFAVLSSLLAAFPASLWVENAKEHLSVLWNSCFHARTCNTTWKSSFATLCHSIMKNVLLHEKWENRPVAALDICAMVLSEVDRNNFVDLLVSSLREKSKKGESLHPEAVEWCIENALGARPSASELLLLADKLQINSSDTKKSIWENFPGIFRRWRIIHEKSAVNPTNAEFLLIDSYEYFRSYNAAVAENNVWWDPILDSSHQQACTHALSHLSELLGPAKAMSVCERRLKALSDYNLASSVEKEIHEYHIRARTEAIQAATTIINTVRGVELRECLRHALAIGQAYTNPSLPSPDCLLAASLDALDAVVEGRARVVCEKDEEFRSRWIEPDLLSHLIDCYLSTPVSTHTKTHTSTSSTTPTHITATTTSSTTTSSTTTSSTTTSSTTTSSTVIATTTATTAIEETRSEALDRKVLELCDRADAHLLIFFGVAFSKHLCFRRQAELHALLEKLIPFPTTNSTNHNDNNTDTATNNNNNNNNTVSIEDFEFYHWEMPEHALSEFIDLHIPLAMLHPTTQSLLLHKGLLGSTRLENLSALPMFEYIDTTRYILDILDAHPRAQSAAPLAAASAEKKLSVPKNNNDLEEVANCRFRNLSPPSRTDEVQQKHVDTLILALGHADNTDRAMVVLSKYAGFHKFARDALVRTIKTLSKSHARRVITQLITPSPRDNNDSSSSNKSEKMGVSTLVHMLRLALELRVDRVVDLCIAVFREGACHRDILAVMLSKLVVFEGFSPSELQKIRVLYNLSSTSRDKDDQSYIARTVLQDIKNLKPWTLPFVCEVLSSDWCYVPGVTGEVFSALLVAPSCGANITSVAEALTSVLSSARVLANVEFHDSHNLAGDWRAVNGQSAATALVSSQKLNQCDRGALTALVREIFSSPSVSKNLGPALDLWIPLAEADLSEVDWLVTQLKEFETSQMNSAFERLVEITVARSSRAVARKVVQIAREVLGPNTPLGVQLLVSGWAQLVAMENDEKELQALFADKIAISNIMAVTQILFKGHHRWPALEWLSQSAACSEAPCPGLPVLVDLCTSVFAEKDATITTVQKVLELFNRHSHSSLCVKLIQGLELTGPVSREVHRLGLQWLTPLFPRAAVQMYPKFLSRFEPPSIQDVDTLLAVCVKYHLELPPLAPGVCRVACASLLASPIVEARVLAARVLGKDQRLSELQKLLADSSPVVRSAAQSLLPKGAIVEQVSDPNPSLSSSTVGTPDNVD